MVDGINLFDFLSNNNIISLNTYFYFIKTNKPHNEKYEHFYYELLEKTLNFNTNNISEMIYVVLNGLTEIPKCKECQTNTVEFRSFKKGYKNFCCASCQGKNLHKSMTNEGKNNNKNKYKDEKKRENSNLKRRMTNLKKYGSIGACKGKTSNFIKKQYQQEKIKYDNIIELYSKDDVHKLLNSNEYYYKNYFGKGKVRTLKSKNLKLYKSIIEHTKEFVNDIPHYNFSASLLIAAELNFDVSNHYCNCGKTILYDVTNLTIKTTGICKFCDKQNSGFSIGNYKVRFGNNYLDEWHKACQNRTKKILETYYKNKEGINSHSSILKVSREFFSKLIKKLKNTENIYTDVINHEYIVYLTKEDLKILNENNIEKHIFYLDFWQNNKVIEFNGTYWHKNLKHVDEIRKYILEKNHGMSVMFVDECEYYKNPDIILAKCVNFLEET